MDAFNLLVIVTVFVLFVCVIVKASVKKNPDAAKGINEKFGDLSAALGKKIVEVKMLGAGSTDYKRGGLGGAVVGGMVAGPLGAVVGGATPSGKGKQKQRFAIKYSDGSVEIKEVRTNSQEYRNLMKYVAWEDIR